MTTYAATWLPMASSEAAAIAAITKYSDGLDAVGVLKTTDTGQIDLTGGTTLLPGTAAANTFIELGYQVRSLKSSGKPDIILRFSYGFIASAANTASTYRLHVRTTIGASTNGAGVLNTVLATLNAHNTNTGPSTNTSTSVSRPLYMSSDGGNYLSVINDPVLTAESNPSVQLSTARMDFCVERTISATTGLYDSAGASAVCNTYQGAENLWFAFNLGSGVSLSSHPFPTGVGAILTSSASLGTAIVFAIPVLIPEPKGVFRSALGAFTADVTPGATFTVSMYGTSITYMCGGASCFGAFLGTSTSSRAPYSLLFRYE